MLVLTRKPHERIIIGENILIVFLGMTGDEAKLGFTAPMSMPIHREEIYHKIKSQKKYQTCFYKQNTFPFLYDQDTYL